MPVSPSGVSGISAGHFRTCRSLDELWIFRVGQDTFLYRRAEGFETTKTPSTLQAGSFFRILSWNSASQHPLFLSSFCLTCLFKHLTPWKFQSLRTRAEILWKSWFAWAIHKHFFSCYAIFTWIWTYKTHDPIDYQLTIGSFLTAITFMWSDRQIPGWPQFFQQQIFPSVPSMVDFKIAIIFRRFYLDFLCAYLAAAIISYHLFSNFRCARHIIHPENCSPAPYSAGLNCPIIFLKASSSSSRVRIWPLWSLRTICLRNFSRYTHAPPLKAPLMPSPACFNHLIIFESLLLGLSRANPPTPIAPDRLFKFSKLHSLPSSTVKRRCRDSRDGSAEPSRRHWIAELDSEWQ